MGLIDDHMIEAIDRAVLCWLATVDADGMPNVSPKEVFAHLDGDRVVVAHIASPVSVRNLRSNPRACLSFVDVFTQRGWKLKGDVRVVEPDDPTFEEVSTPLSRIAGDAFTIRAAIELTVTSAGQIVAPSYVFHSVSEESMVASAMRTYGVRPLAE
jgi:uncharacterized protein